MKTLFIHQNFPGQFRHLAPWLAAQPGHEVVCVGQRDDPPLPGTVQWRYQPKRMPGAATHHYLRGMEAAVLNGQAVLELLLKLKTQGFVPDVIVAHPAWGESLYAKLAYPDVPLVHYCEFFYQLEGADVGFDPEAPMSIDQRARLVTRNALHLLNLQQCDLGVTPTHWQKSVHPLEYQPKLEVLHEGVDTAAARPDGHASFALPDGRVLTKQHKVVTFVARNLEPYRGFPQFLRALAQVQQADAQVQALVIGGDGVSYGSPPQGAANWREHLVPGSGIDPQRTHFLGRLPHAQYLQALQVSSLHVYLTYPFVLSWSLLEAMACGAPVMASRTAPVQEVIDDGRNGRLVDFFDTEAQARCMLAMLHDPAAQRALTEAAAATVAQRYSAHAGCAQWQALLRRVTQCFLFAHCVD